MDSYSGRMTTKFELERNNITSEITMRDCWAIPGDVTVEERMNNKTLYYVRINEESAVNLAYELLGNHWRVTYHSY